MDQTSNCQQGFQAHSNPGGSKAQDVIAVPTLSYQAVHLYTGMPNDVNEEAVSVDGDSEMIDEGREIKNPTFRQLTLGDDVLHLSVLEQTYQEEVQRLNQWVEYRKRVEANLAAAQQRSQAVEQDLGSTRDRVALARTSSGISPELWDAYWEFCRRIDFGRGGFAQSKFPLGPVPNDSYLQYDPDLSILKNLIRQDCYRPVLGRNWKCITMCDLSNDPVYVGTENLVEFWPLASPEIGTEIGTTWGEQHPALYKLAKEAVRNGSEAAMGMLLDLPDEHANFRGGWLFKYACSDAHIILHSGINLHERMQVIFRAAHKIDAPVDRDTKRRALEEMLKSELMHLPLRLKAGRSAN